MSKPSKQVACTFCIKPAKTRDHIPPKGLFAMPRPQNLITVPACQKCNNSSSDDDAYLMRLSLAWGAETSNDGNEVGKEVLRSIHNPKLQRQKRELYSSLTPIELRSKMGLYLAQSFRIVFEKARMQKILDKIVSGLFRHETKENLPPNFAIIHQQYGKASHEEFSLMERQIMCFELKTFGDNAFGYRYVAPKEMPGHSVWKLDFYNTISYMSYTVNQLANETEMLQIYDLPNQSQ